MARRPRLDRAGFHHIVNRGVERKNITLQEHFTDTQDLQQRNKDIITAIENG